MKAALLCLALTVSNVAYVTNASSVTPVAKVIQMLQGMLEKAKTEKTGETDTYTTFAGWCHDVDMTKSRDIKDGTELIDSLTADIAKYESQIDTLQTEIEALDMDIASWEGDKDEAQKMRRHEYADYEATRTDYSESIDALERAINVLKKQDYNREQAAALLQEVALLSHMPADARRVITAFLAQDSNTEGFMDYDAPESAAYEFQSGSVVDMLEKLLTKFEDELSQLNKEESNARHAFEMLHQDLENQIATGTQTRNDKSTAKAETEEALAQAKGDLSETYASRDADQKYLDETNALCQLKTSEYEARQRLRGEEIDTIAQAIEIIAGITHHAAKHLPTLAQTSLLQLRAVTMSYKDSAQKFLRSKAAKLNSRVLTQLADRMDSDPFGKVKALIQDLLNRLMDQAIAEADHKGWCDTELATNEHTRNTKTQAINDLSAQIDKMNADIAKLSLEIQDLTDEVAALDAEIAAATQTRADEHAKNTETIADAKESQAAVSQALSILRAFYSMAADATALNQADPTKDAPETWTTKYHGQQGAGGGVIGMLEVIQSDFVRLEAETTSDEASALKQFKKFMVEAAVTKTAKTKDIEYKTLQKDTTNSKLTTAEKDRQGEQESLNAALAYYEKLKPSCVDAGVSYEDRTARRKEEIESLREALRILSGEDFAA